MDTFKVRISPEFLQSAIVSITTTGNTNTENYADNCYSYQIQNSSIDQPLIYSYSSCDDCNSFKIQTIFENKFDIVCACEGSVSIVEGNGIISQGLSCSNPNQTQVWTGMTDLLSGGTNGDSVLTGLTIPIMFNQTYKDIGYYTGFDGAIYQKDINNNFIYSATTGTPFVLYVYNTSENYVQDIFYQIDWGDNSPIEQITVKAPEYISHNYASGPLPSTENVYTVTMSGTAAWGTTVTTKKITLPYSELTTPNEEGEYYFIPMGTYWSGTPISYKWFFTGDSQNNYQSQITSSYTEVPFLVTGFTNSKLSNLRLYGANPYIEGVPVISKGDIVGVVDNLGPDYTGYTYQNVKYFDFPANSDNPKGYTLFIENSSGLTENNISLIPIVKEEILIGMVNGTEIQSSVFIDRGKLSGNESLLRLGEIDSVNDLINYGYGYFIIKNT
jgi:hypothetical protein